MPYSCKKLILQHGYPGTPGEEQYFAMFRQEDDTCICTRITEWTALPAGPVSVRMFGIRPGTLP